MDSPRVLNSTDLDGATIHDTDLTPVVGVGDMQLRKMAREGHFPPPVRRMYQLVPVLKGLLNFYRRGSRHGGGDINAEKLRVERLKGDILEIERDKKRGKLADTKQVEVIWEGLAMSMRGKLLSLPAKLSPLVLQCKTVEECRRQLETEINDVLAELSKPHDYATDAQQTAAEVIALTDEPDYDEAEAEADATPTAGE